jgi:tetratricopeptide (TPR) repeat protein
MHPLSFACASPEQLRGEPLSLASDVYALGTLLYEVLTGVNPQYRPDVSVEESFRLVLERVPPPPSAVVRSVPRDLDAITLKALAKAPAERYASVSELDADLARWLDGRPVMAVAPRPWYVAVRFVRRNQALSGTAAALILSLVAGIVAVERQARIADRRFEDARQLIHTTIFDIQPKLEAIPGTLPLRTTLIEETMKYLEAVSRDAGGNVALLRELSNAFQQLARVQGDISTSTLGNQDAAADRYGKAQALLDAALAIEPRNPDLLKDAALLLGRMAGFENARGASDASLAHAVSAVSYAERNLGARPGDRDARQVLAGAVFYQAMATPAEQWEVRKEVFERALAMYADLAADPSANEAVRRNVGILNRHLSALHYDRAMAAPAVAHARTARGVSEAVLAARPRDAALQIDAAQDAYVLGMSLDLAGAGAAAPEHYARARALLEGVRAADRSNVRATLLLGETARYSAANRLATGDLAAARQESAEAAALFALLGQQGPMLQAVKWRYAAALATQADVETASGGRAEACKHYLRSAALFDEAHQQSALTHQVKRNFDRVRGQAAECGPPRK